MSHLRWGIIGCGQISFDFVQAMRKCVHPHMIVAIAASNWEKAKNLKQVLCLGEGVTVYGSYEELLANANVEVVYIGLVNHVHHDIVIKALNRDKHVLCEKPLGLNVRQVHGMVQKSRQKKLFLMEGFHSRFFPCWNQIRTDLENKTLGELTSIHANIGSDYFSENRFHTPDGAKPIDSGSTPLMDFGLYTINFALWIFKDEMPQKIIAYGRKDETGADKFANITLEFSKGKKAFLLYSAEDIMPNSAFISCTDGHLLIPEFFHCPTRLIRVRGKQKVGENSAEGIEFPLEDDAFYIYNNSSGLRYEADHVFECLRKGRKESDLMSLETTEKLAEIIQEIRRQLDIVLPQDKQTNHDST
uniref:Trans-1,2-dihydrobenzene-1,2-diol dehydrogenase n=1 Tax=Acrobeloides nanus TaxID=290746 RepID=A0A914DLA3_9BILA